jgi:hypothetical protein
MNGSDTYRFCIGKARMGLLGLEVSRLKEEVDALRQTLHSIPAPDATLNRLNRELRALHGEDNLTLVELARAHKRTQEACSAHGRAVREAAATGIQLVAELAAIRGGLPISVQSRIDPSEGNVFAFMRQHAEREKGARRASSGMLAAPQARQSIGRSTARFGAARFHI